MTERSTRHATFSIERQYGASPARVFHAWADPAAKAQWFAGTAGRWHEQIRESNFRVGGRDRVVGAWKDGPVSAFECVYQDIVTNERIVYTYDMHLDGTRISVSPATVEFRANGGGTKLIVTEQGVFLDAYDDAGSREQGTRALLENLAIALAAANSQKAAQA